LGPHASIILQGQQKTSPGFNEKGVSVYAVEDDVEERGIDAKNCIDQADPKK
jgi:hypothetical protein